MQLIIASVGRLRDPPSRALFDEYQRRIAWPLIVREVELKRPLAAEQTKAEEAKLLLDAIGNKAVIVALDERGQEWSSVEFATRIGSWSPVG